MEDPKRISYRIINQTRKTAKNLDELAATLDLFDGPKHEAVIQQISNLLDSLVIVETEELTLVDKE